MKKRPQTLPVIALLLLGVAVGIVVWPNTDEADRTSTSQPVDQTTERSAKVVTPEEKAKPLEPVQVKPSLQGFDDQAIAKVTPPNPASPQELDLTTLAGILSYQKNGTARERVKALEDLGILDPDEVRAAYDFLKTNRIPAGLRKSTYHWFVDELMSTLRRQEKSHKPLSSTLSAVAMDEKRDPIVRDYALQHLGHLHEQGGGNKTAIESTLWQASQHKGDTLAGTALLALSQAKQDGRISKDPTTVALKIARDSDYSQASRISALGVAARSQSPALTTLAQEIAADKSSPTLLRVTAISALANSTNSSSHKSLLESFKYATDRRLRIAANSALQKLSQR